LFSVLFNKQQLIVQKNSNQISNAKDILLGIDSSLQSDVEENFERLYISFYTTFSSSLSITQKSGEASERIKYFENFANNNVEFFLEYPLSRKLKGTSTSSMKELLNEIFEATLNLSDEQIGNRQLISVKMISEFLEDNRVDFALSKFEEFAEKNPFVNASKNPVSFPYDVKPAVEDIINELSDFSELDQIGLGWVTGTRWEPYVKFICGIISLEEISENVKKVATTIRSLESFTYQQKLDTDEKDGGTYFINNWAFADALSKTESLKTLGKDFEEAIAHVAEKTEVFTGLSGNELLKNLFFSPNKNGMSYEIDDPKYSKDKETLRKIMSLTDLDNDFGKTFMTAVQQINFMFYQYDVPWEQRMFGGVKTGSRNYEAVKYAFRNVGDVMINEVRKDLMSSFSPRTIYKTLTGFGQKTGQFFDKIFQDGSLSIENVVKSFNETFGADFNFVTIQEKPNQEGKYVLLSGDDEYPAIELNSVQDIKDYVKKMSSSIGSIMFHGKVALGGNVSDSSYSNAGEEERYKTYFNVLSWFLDTLNKYSKKRIVFSEMPFAYTVTPFLIDVVKYSFRGLINNITDVLYEDGKITKEEKENYDQANEKTSMKEGEWKPLAEQLSKSIQAFLKEKEKSMIA